MTSLTLTQQNCTINVPFHGSELYVVNHNGEPYTPMRPIIDGMGLAYKGQIDKLKGRFAKGVMEIIIPTKGGAQTMICLALRKLAAWLNTISPNKVKPNIRDNVIRYQEECDDVLYEYWTKGQVTNPRKTSTDERTPLRDAINLLVGKRGIMYPEAYSYVHQRFNVGHIDEIEAAQLPLVIEYVHRLALEGELMPKNELVESTNKPFNFQMYVHNANAACMHMEVITQAWREELFPSLKKMGSPLAGKLEDRIKDAGAIIYGIRNALERTSGYSGLQYK